MVTVEDAQPQHTRWCAGEPSPPQVDSEWEEEQQESSDDELPLPLAACTACGAPKTARGVVLKHRAGCPWDTTSLSRAQFLAQQAVAQSPASDDLFSPSPPPRMSPLQQLRALHAGATAAVRSERQPVEPVDVDLSKKRRKKLKVQRVLTRLPTQRALAKRQRKMESFPRTAGVECGCVQSPRRWVAQCEGVRVHPLCTLRLRILSLTSGKA
jgi:hypothetical protein